MPIKDKDYWKLYNQKRKAYLAQKARQRRAKDKRIQPPSAYTTQVKSIQPVYNSERIQPAEQVNRIQPEKVVDQVKMSTTKLWSDYYSAKKPSCLGCQRTGIKEAEYSFCSENLLALHNYVCVVKHWTIYQGKRSFLD